MAASSLLALELSLSLLPSSSLFLLVRLLRAASSSALGVPGQLPQLLAPRAGEVGAQLTTLQDSLWYPVPESLTL